MMQDFTFFGTRTTCIRAVPKFFCSVNGPSIVTKARLPQKKIDKRRDLISASRKPRKVTLREIQSLTGLLNFACTVVVPGLAFLRHLIHPTPAVRSPHFLIFVFCSELTQ